MKRKLEGQPPRLKIPPGATDTQMHAYPAGFASEPGAIPLPPNPPGIPEYRKVMQWLGIERVVITQGNAYGRNNAALLAALAEAGDIARGVAVVTPETGPDQLRAWHDAGVRGARIMNLPGGAVGLADISAVNALVAPLGWMIAVQFDGTHLLDYLPLLESLEGRYVIDHHGKFFGGITPQDARIAGLKRLVDRGNCYVKLAGCYESSRVGPPDYGDVGAVAAEIVRHAPDRIVWGTNWPHNAHTVESDYPDDAALLDLLLDWVPLEEDRRRILVDNPAALFDFP